MVSNSCASAKVVQKVRQTMIDDAALLIDSRTAAALCGSSRSHWHALRAAGKVPPPVKLGRKVLWRRQEIVDWEKGKGVRVPGPFFYR